MRPGVAWALLLAAGLIEVVMALALKQAQGWTRLGPSVLGLAAALGSVALLTMALARLPAGAAYAVWTGIGAVGVTLASALLLGEPLSAAKLAWMGMIFAGAVGLRLDGAG